MKIDKYNKSSIVFVLLILFGTYVSISSLSSNYIGLRNVSNQIQNKLESVKTYLITRFIPTKEDVIIEPQKEDTINLDYCSPKEKLQFENISNLGLLEIKEAQELCNSFVSDTQMIFIEMPNSEVSASRLGLKVSNDLKEFYANKITPIVIIEPVTSWGLIDFMEFNEGFYNKWTESFFNRMKAEGVADDMMGIWVPFPEANLPYWNKGESKPEIFGQNINLYSKLLKKHYPNTKISILLNTVSYPSEDENWENGKYSSLLPYLKDINKEDIHSFGIQGFPWRSPRNSKNPIYIYDPAEFINPKIALEAAQFLNTKNIWINTGTFRAKFTSDPNLIVTVTAKDRGDILNEIVAQAKYIQDQGYIVSINLFAENKTETPEATDWSYFSKNMDKDDENFKIFKTFISDLEKNKISLWYFDR